MLNRYPRFDGYKILKQISTTPSGPRFKAADQTRQDHCALHLLTPQDPNLATAFSRAQQAIEHEAQRLYSLDHPRIAPYRQPFSTQYQQQPCQILVQAWVNGTSYKQHLKTRRFEPTQVLRFLQSTLPVLEYLHHRKIIHGDICPSNLIYCPDSHKPILINFAGAQRALWQNITPQHLRQSLLKSLYAHPVYSPPEQQNGKIHPKSDLYALAVTAIALLTGQNDPSIFYDSTRQHWTWQHSAPTSAELSNVLQLMLQPDPSDRPSAQDLNQLIQQGIPTSTPNPAPPITDTFPATEAPPSQAKTIAHGRKALNTEEVWGTRTPHYTGPVVKLLEFSEPINRQLLQTSIPIFLILVGVGASRVTWNRWATVFTPQPPASPFLQNVAVAEDTSGERNAASATKVKDCRNDVLARGEALQIESWQEVDQRFSDSYPNVETIDPLDPEHRPYIQTWCNLANEWMEQG